MSSPVAQSSGKGRFRRVFIKLQVLSVRNHRRDQSTYLSFVLSILLTIFGCSGVGSTCIASPLVSAPERMLRLASASRASSRSLVTRAITLTAASCWYSALLKSCLVCARFCRKVYVSSASASHSSWKTERSDGIDVRVGGLGRTVFCVLRSIRSSIERVSPVVGSVPFSVM